MSKDLPAQSVGKDKAVGKFTRRYDNSVKELQTITKAVRGNGRVVTAMLDLMRPIKAYLDHFLKAAKPTQRLEDAVGRELAFYHRIRSSDVPVLSTVPRFSLVDWTPALKRSCASVLAETEQDTYAKKRTMKAKRTRLLEYANRRPELWFD